MRIAKFLTTGAIGITINLSIYHTLVVVGVQYLAGSAIALGIAMIVGFLLQKYWTFEEHSPERARVQFMQYVGVGLAGLALNSAVVYLLVGHFGVWYLLAQAIGAGIVAVFSFFMYREIIFKQTI